MNQEIIYLLFYYKEENNMNDNEEIKIGLSILTTSISILGICLGLRTRTIDARKIVTTRRRGIYLWLRI